MATNLTKNGYSPEVLRELEKLANTPLDADAPEEEKEFMDWLNSD